MVDGPLEPGMIGGHRIENDRTVTFHPDFEAARPQPIAGVTLFSAGPLYWLTGYDRDLITQFDPTVVAENFFYTDPVLAVDGWEYVLQGLPDEVFVDFQKFMLNTTFTRAVDRVLYRVAAVKLLLPGSTHAVFFYARSNKTWYLPHLSYPNLWVGLATRPPDEELIREASRLFAAL